MEAKFIRFDIDGYKGRAIYEYNSFIQNLIYQYKGCCDYELFQVFMNPFFKEISLRYKGYKLIPAPSYKDDDEKRGFNHVIEAFKILGLDVLDIAIKTAHHKQAEKSKEQRKDIRKYLMLKEHPDLSKEKVLIVDDIYTTGATIRSLINMVEKLNPKKICVLVLAKTRNKLHNKTNTNYF